jgi:hypothetical protein
MNLLAYAKQHNISEEILDDFVHDVASDMATATNNGGLSEQIQFLTTTVGEEQTKSILQAIVKAEAS